MLYEIIQLPFDPKFREKSKKELKDYFHWFINILPERIEGLIIAVKKTPGFELWQPDYSPDSLIMLGDWFAEKAELRIRTQEEIRKIKDKLSFPIDISDKELTNQTFSLAIDIGMYLSQVFLRNHPSLRWEQPFGSKKFVDYGQPVLEKFDPAPFNPVRIMIVLAYSLVSKNKTDKTLIKMYNLWSKTIINK